MARTAAVLLITLTVVGDGTAGSGIVINEVMYHPSLDCDDLQYVELFNRGTNTADLTGWSFTRGIAYDFPAQSALKPGAFLVVCRNRIAFLQEYGGELPAVGNWNGRLSHQGETIELRNAGDKLVDKVAYSDREPWPTGADGTSASLERICPFESGGTPHNWAASTLPQRKKPAGTPGRTNDNYLENLPPAVLRVEMPRLVPGQTATATAEITDPDGVGEVHMLYRVVKPGANDPETVVAMRRISGDAVYGKYEASLDPQHAGALLRIRVQAKDSKGAVRLQPGPNETRPTYSCATFINTNTAAVPFIFAWQLSSTDVEPSRRGPNSRSKAAEPTRGNGVFFYLPPRSNQVLTFDHVQIRPRGGGFKVHFQKDRPLNGMTGINLLFEGPPRWVLSEQLAYELYRMAGVPAPLSEHVRVWLDDQLLGYHLLVEQPNNGFLARHQRDGRGNLYKLLWYGHGIIGQHEKKTNPATGHDDIVSVINGLNQASGRERWQYIQHHFNVEEFINYFAVNMCIQNWDGFFNNYFTYHDTGGTGKWEIYPWDEDKTWGDYDGASASCDWYTMPLTFGMSGDQPPQPGIWAFFGGGASWWRPAGYFSGPMLATAEFRKQFLTRLGELCHTLFTEEKFVPIIDALERRLEPEVAVRAQVTGENREQALNAFRRDIQSFRNQVTYRRKFILKELGKSGVAQ